MAKCISFEQAKKRREILGRPLRRTYKVVSLQRNLPLARGDAAKLRTDMNAVAGWQPKRNLHLGLAQMLFALFFPDKRKTMGPHAAVKGVGPLAS